MKLYDKFKELEELKTEENSGVARQRGLDFEKLIRDLFYSQKLLSVVKTSGYHTSDNKSEQIDGVINLNGKIFLLEAKWAKSLAASSLYEFIGKIENKFYGTLGIYISYYKLSDNFLNALRKGRKQNVIVIHGNDVELLFKETIDLKEFLNYTIEKLSFDNLPYISVEDYLDSKKTISNKPLTNNINNSKITNFFQKNILIDSSIEPLEMQVEFDNLNDDEKAKAYLALFKYSSKVLKLTFPIPKSYFNLRTFFSIYKPDFEKRSLRNLPNEYYSNYIFENTSVYLFQFLEDFLEEFTNVEPESKKVFFDRIAELYNAVDWEGENYLTVILEKYESEFPEETLNKIHKKYISYYYSLSREDRFKQKQYAIELFATDKISENTIYEWIKEKMQNDIRLYSDFQDFNLNYFASTYRELGKILGLDLDEWILKVQSIKEELE